MAYNPNLHHRKSIRLKGYSYAQAGLYFITICCQHRAHLFGQINKGEMQLNHYGKIAATTWANTEKIRDNVYIHEYIIMPNHIHGIIEILTTKEEKPQKEEAKKNQSETTLISGKPEAYLNSEKSEESKKESKESISGNISGESEIGNIRGESDNISGESEIEDIRGESGNISGESEGEFDKSTGELQFAPTVKKFHSPSQTIGSIIRGFKIATIKRIKDYIIESETAFNSGGLKFGPTEKIKSLDFKIWQRNYYEHIIRNERAFQNISNYIINNPKKWEEDKFFKK